MFRARIADCLCANGISFHLSSLATMDPPLEENSQDLLRVGETASLFLQKTNCALDPARFDEFWKKMKAASYAAVLMTKLITMYSGEDKHVQLYEKVKALASNNLGPMPEVRIETDLETSQNQQCVMVTLFFVGTFFPFAVGNSSLKVALGRLTNLRGKLSQLQPSCPDALFLTELEKIYSQPSYYNSLDGLKFAIQQACFFDNMANFDYNKISARSMASSFLQSSIRTRLNNPETSNQIFEILIQLLQHPSISDSLILPLLHMLKVYLCSTPFPPVSLITRIIAAVTPYYIWPRPYSDSARDVLEIAAVEYKAPGTNLRTTLMEENPLLIPGMGPTPDPSLAIGRERRTHLLFDKDFPRCRLLSEILKQHIPTQLSTVDVQLRFLASVFVTVLKVKIDSLGLEYATQEQICKYYGTAVNLLEQAISMSDSDALQHCIAELTALKKKIMSEIGSVANFKTPKLPKLPPLIIQSKLVSFSVDTLTINSEQGRHHYPKRESFDHLLEILLDGLDIVIPGEKPPVVKIAVVGGDSTIHNLCTGFVTLNMMRPELFEKLDVRFYFIPATNSDFANYIASLDPWYARQAIILTRAIQGICPSPNSSESTSSLGPSRTPPASVSGRSMSMVSRPGSTGFEIDLLEEQSKLTSPSSILHNELEYLYREAKYTLPINIYRVECFSSGQTITLPFFARACIGLSACIEAFKKSNDLPSNLTEAEVLSYRNFKWNPPNISMKYIQMNPSNVARAIGQQDARHYTNITLASLPVAGDKANFLMADPSRPYLELSLIEDKKKKTTSRDDPRTYHVSQVEATGAEPFDLLLDGVVYGPFTRAKFTPATHSDKDEIYRMNFMTFLPTEGLH